MLFFLISGGRVRQCCGFNYRGYTFYYSFPGDHDDAVKQSDTHPDYAVLQLF